MPQYNFLLLIVIAIVVLMVFLNMRANKRKQSYFKTRNDISLEGIHATYQVECPLSTFIAAWCRFAELIDLPPERLYPEDKITDIKSIFPIDDIFYETMEDFLMQYDLQNITISDKTTIMDIVKTVCNSAGNRA